MTPCLRGKSVIVVGAGLAGLTAAVELSHDGATVLVLEAKDRIGGRVWTIRHGFAAGQHAEAGGEFIDEDQQEIRLLARHLNLHLVPVLKQGFSFATRRTHATRPQLRAGTKLWADLHRHLSPLIRAYRLADQRWDSAVAHQLARISAAQWLESIGAAEDLRAMVRSLRGFFLADASELPVLLLVEQLIAGSPGQGRSYRVKGGNDQWAQGLSAFLGDAIRLDTHVEDIIQTSKKVFITALDGDGRQKKFRADYVVLTVPGTVVRSLRFDPPLSALSAAGSRDTRLWARDQNAPPVQTKILAREASPEGLCHRSFLGNAVGGQRGTARPTRHPHFIGRRLGQPRPARHHDDRDQLHVIRADVARSRAQEVAGLQTDTLGERSLPRRGLCILHNGL